MQNLRTQTNFDDFHFTTMDFVGKGFLLII